MTNVPQTASPAAIQKHYDVGREFYALWLDPTMSYSCATWHQDDRDDALEAAQLRKLDDHTREAGATGAARVLDIGCGWGALLVRLLGTHRVANATGLTLSRDQADFVKGLALAGADVRYESWVDHAPAVPYDAIVSIGAFEHFARPGILAAERHAIYRSFFERCREWLVPRGGMSLQTIAYGNLARGDVLPFMHDVFPESDLPRLSEIVLAAEGLFEIVRVRNDRADYSRTCYVWRQRLNARRDEAVALVGEETVALYDRYLVQSRFGFVSGATELLRVTLKRIDEPRTAR